MCLLTAAAILAEGRTDCLHLSDIWVRSTARPGYLLRSQSISLKKTIPGLHEFLLCCLLSKTLNASSLQLKCCHVELNENQVISS
ncbi:hypothetical protein TNIN_151601 [Trichonephila inaurata madagascariensis]|uniref:Uncharacterized protein n=1 Tax=Trichonephila inaurata madagascariensis TaxID=2747483 RepID=A0A8X6WVF0_9ARAC|nr:hypothetical protein TNIN_151601 [Trichonephila inaurata madagascariensis]